MMISDERLMRDIKNTAIEYDAYNQLQSGYLALSNLPECSKEQKEKYYLEH